MDTALYYGHWVLAYVFGYAIPWWTYLLLGIAACVGLILSFPGRLGIIAGVAALTIGGDIAFYSYGQEQGIQLERTTWERKMAAETKRLREEADEQLETEKARASLAEASRDYWKGQVDELSSTPPSAAGSSPVPSSGNSVADTGIVIPESVTRKLYEWHGRPRRGGPR